MFEFILFVFFVLVGLLLSFCDCVIPCGKHGSAQSRKKLTLFADKSSYLSDKQRSWMPGFRLVPVTTNTADWVYGLGISSRGADKIVARLKSRMDAVEFTDKVKFHEHALKIAPWTVAPTVELVRGSDGRVVPVGGQDLPQGPWMMRANWGWHGKGSGVASNKVELVEWFEKLSDKPQDIVSRSSIPPRIIASEYVLDPLTYEGRKFHARVNLIITLRDDRRYAVMLNTIEIIVSAKPYVKGDWSDSGVHDTHYIEDQITPFLEDMPEPATLRKNTIDALRTLFGEASASSNMLQFVRSYPEATATCEFFGLVSGYNRS